MGLSTRRPSAARGRGPPADRLASRSRAGRGRPEGARPAAAARSLRADLVDAAVLEAYGLVRDERWLADRALDRVLRRERRLWASERRAVAESVYGMIRWQGQLEWLLGRGGYGEPGPRRDLSATYAAWLARGGGLGASAAAARLGLPSSALGNLARAGERLAAIADPAERLAAEASLPVWMAGRLVAEMGLEEASALARAMNERAPLTVRANLLRGTREALRERLASEGVTAEPTPHSPWGLVLDGHANAFALAAFRDGLFEIQDEGSQIVALACGVRPGWTVVDACAGAGGKSLALAMEMHNKGSLHALDVDAGRLAEARRRARRAGVHNLRTRVVPPAGAEAEAAAADLAGRADLVLVDAPCSGLGALRRKPDARWRIEPGDPERFAGAQRELGARFARLVRPGGRFLYATCAVGRTENEEVAAFLAAEVPGLVPMPLERTLGPELARALGAGGHLLRLSPDRHGTDGFFAAAFERAR